MVLRRLAPLFSAAASLALVFFAVAPLVHLGGHRDDHVHLPDGSILWTGAGPHHHAARGGHHEPLDGLIRWPAPRPLTTRVAASDWRPAAKPSTLSNTIDDDSGLPADPERDAPDPVDDAPRHGIGAVAHLGSAPVLTLPPSLPEPPPLVIAAPAGRIITSPRTPNARPQHTPRQARAPPA